jgi:hypothetical protein
MEQTQQRVHLLVRTVLTLVINSAQVPDTKMANAAQMKSFVEKNRFALMMPL